MKLMSQIANRAQEQTGVGSKDCVLEAANQLHSRGCQGFRLLRPCQ